MLAGRFPLTERGTARASQLFLVGALGAGGAGDGVSARSPRRPGVSPGRRRHPHVTLPDEGQTALLVLTRPFSHPLPECSQSVPFTREAQGAGKPAFEKLYDVNSLNASQVKEIYSVSLCFSRPRPR